MDQIFPSFVHFQDGEIVYTDWTQGKEESDQGEYPEDSALLHICPQLIMSY